MKIIIVGAGIGGLSTYLALRKYLVTDASAPSDVIIKVYESHGSPSSTTSNIGGGLGLAPNGQRAIASVAPDAAKYVQEHGFPGSRFTFRTSKGRLLGNLYSGRKERYGFDMLMMRRSDVHEGLLSEMPSDAVEWNRKVEVVKETAEGISVTFSDGTSELADLVIGADGVRSVVRTALFGDQYPAAYDGLTGVGGFIPFSSLSESLRGGLNTENVTMTFGQHGFFGYSMCGPHNLAPSEQFIQWWSIYESAVPPDRKQDHAIIRSQLLERHGSWASPYDGPDAPVFETLIRLGCSDANDENRPNDTLLILPRYVVPRMPHWCTPSGSGRVILLGDAAHAMPPDSGQGVSCAAEDSVALAMFLHHYSVARKLDRCEALKRTAAAYEAVRMKRVGRILDIAKFNGNIKKKQSWLQERIRDFFISLFCAPSSLDWPIRLTVFVAGKLPEAVNDSYFGHDVQKAVQEYIRMDKRQI